MDSRGCTGYRRLRCAQDQCQYWAGRTSYYAGTRKMNYNHGKPEIKYRQCRLQRWNIHQTSWIPEKFAVVGKFLKLHEENGWQVKEVGTVALDESVVNDHSQDFKRQRKASDI